MRMNKLTTSEGQENSIRNTRSNSRSVHQLLQIVLSPNSVHHLSTSPVKISLSLHHVLFKRPLEHFSVRKLKPSIPVLEVLHEISYINQQIPS